jgi:Flp pilus assembly pilin Flp
VRRPTKTENFPDCRGESGVAMTEYALILALITVVAFGLVGAVGDATVDLYTDIADVVHTLLS